MCVGQVSYSVYECVCGALYVGMCVFECCVCV